MDNRLVLFIEDRSADVRIAMEGLAKLNEKYTDNPIKMDVIMDGKEAYEHLCQLNEEEQMPCIILLNLNLPGMSGPELLTEIRKMPKFNRTPIIIHTSVTAFYYSEIFVMGANAFMQKPLEVDDCIEAYAETIDYWLNCHTKYYFW